MRGYITNYCCSICESNGLHVIPMNPSKFIEVMLLLHVNGTPIAIIFTKIVAKISVRRLYFFVIEGSKKSQFTNVDQHIRVLLPDS